MTRGKQKRKSFAHRLPQNGMWIIVIAVVVSLFVHLLSILNLTFLSRELARHRKVNITQPIKVNYVQKKTKEKKNEDPDEDRDKRIVEVPQQKTEKPKDASYKSLQDHSTEKETRVDNQIKRERAADASNRQTARKKSGKRKQEEQAAQKSPKQKLEIGSTGDLEFQNRKKEFQKFMPTTNDLAHYVEAGYQDYLDDELAIADRIDINTSEYRYVGYFTNMRKAIELVWNYPTDAARRGMQGEVGVEFIIAKDGSTSRIRVVRSSGYKLLDDAIVEALQLASPFSPLPSGISKDRLVVTGSFRYILSSYLAGAH